jgi:hypothetical protein
MKTLLSVFGFLLIWIAVAPLANAQTNFTLASFQCDPISCAEQTGPTTVGTAFVSYNATCNGGIIASIEGSAKSVIGLDEPCSTPYIAKAQVSTSRTTQNEVDGCGNDVEIVIDTIITNEQILTVLGTTVFNFTQGISCDNATFGPTTSGLAPC